MAIVNLSGNFQPPSVDSGKSLPLPSSGAPSTTNETVLKVVEKVAKDEANIQSVNIQATQATQKDKPVEKTVNNQIEELQQFNQNIDRTLQFKVDEELGVTIVRVVDKETDELIRQFPPEELINLSRRLKELNEQESDGAGASKSGILLQEKV